jgi:hypothetical protein
MSDATDGGAALYLIGAIEAAAAADPARPVAAVLADAVAALAGDGYEWSRSASWLVFLDAESRAGELRRALGQE